MADNLEACDEASTTEISSERADRLFNDPLAVYLRSELARADMREQRVINAGLRLGYEVSALIDESFIDPEYIGKIL